MIDWLNTITVSVSMAADCMTVGAVDGMQNPGMKKRKVFLICAIFGLFQGLMPTIGYFIGYGFKEYLEKYIPWIAFALLCILGIKNIVEWIIERREAKKGKEEKKKELNITTILTQGIATSIDALCIGFVYLEYAIPWALLVFAIIAIVTFGLSLLTTFLGRKIGGFVKDWAGLFAGICFILIGAKILLEGIL